ncbi:ATP-binding protein [Geothrix sp. PMB-07]|uniref:ATP-binding protein n=1 Tax=Geothrix sp. PMB-07 TaxID=3068640 RepID=UPI0027407658|nr:ATP-binding protein [Geothrix sp. PMB-07]WLT30472.1 ATP-binding protein [Geothrix sp. PMB-07]
MVPLRRLLQRELLVLIALLAGLSTLLAWVGMGRSMDQQIQARSRESLARLSSDLKGDLALVERVGGTVDRWWREGRISFKDLPGAEAQIAPMLEEFPLVANLVFVSADGWGVSMSRLSDGLATYHLDARQPQGLKRYLRKAGQRLPFAVWERTPYKVYQRPWWKLATESTSAQWVGAYRFANLPTHGLSYMVPLRGASGELQGAICVDIFLETLSQRAWEAQPTPHAQVLVSDDRGVALILPRTLPKQAISVEGLPFLRPLGPDFLPLFHRLQKDWLRARDKRQPFRLGFGGEGYTCIAEPLVVAAGVDWRLSLAIPDQDVQGPARRLSLLLLLAGVIIMGLATWRVVLLSRRFSAPLEALVAVAQSMGEGETPGPVETRIQEIQALGQAIERAGAAVQQEVSLQRQLLRSQRVQVVGTLSGGIAHDVNNQLAAIVGQLDLARQALPEGDPARHRMDLAEETAHRCSAMVRSLLKFTHQTRHEFLPVDLNGLVRSTATLLGHLLGGRIQLELALEQDLEPIQGDPVGLEQVIMNLAINARDAMPGGGVLTISTGRGVEGSVCLSVTDTGLGIPAEVLPRVFEPFFSTKAAEQGHGLGLAMVSGIIRAHAGRIEVQSQPGKGTEFRVFLPEGHVHEANQPAAEVALQQPPSLQGLRILVVEDEIHLRELLMEMLTLRGAEATPAQDGVQGWERFLQGTFDLVICDQQMPRRTGLELLAQLREGNSELPVILISGHGLEGIEEGQARDARLRILAKPYGLNQLLGLIGQLLGNRGGHPGVPPG